jgi:uncharacterized protein
MNIDGMDESLVKAILETIPGEITIIDANDKLVGWNKHSNRLFYRPETSYGVDFRDCHPQKSLAMVERIVADFKGGASDRERFWVDLVVDKQKGQKHKVLIEFFALRDAGGAYLGCMEHTLDVEEIMGLKGEKRLMGEN